jgi:hypothetical protein
LSDITHNDPAFWLVAGSQPWIIGIGARNPVFKNDEIKLQGIISVFYHFKD